MIDLLQTYAEIGKAGKIAKQIIHQRNKGNMNTTSDLKQAIFKASGDTCSNKILSRIFQAIRIVVNDEIESFKNTLFKVPNYLVAGGRVSIISFHSIEDRIVKHFFKDATMINEHNYYDREKKDTENMLNPITKKPIVASKNEILLNRRSRSAKLRVAEL